MRLAKAHLGNVLGGLKVPNPYHEANSRQEIPPEESVNTLFLTQYTYVDDFQYTNICRELLHRLMDDLRDAHDWAAGHRFILASSIKWPLQHLLQTYLLVSEAANHLGFYLGYMRDVELKKKR